jgi:CheY-like chemotaxis protein
MQQGLILAVDDEPLMLRVIKDTLEDEGFTVVTAENGHQALERLKASPQAFDAVVIDRMMPVMGGMEVLSAIREDSALQHIPVIFQTAETSPQALREGIEAGAYYYITKPYDETTLAPIVRAAVQAYTHIKSIESLDSVPLEAASVVERAWFRFSTLKEAKSVVWMIAQHAADPAPVTVGLMELITNAIEHGNLGIGGATKETLIRQNRWEEEIRRRQSLPVCAGMTVAVEFDATQDHVSVAIKDNGPGFDWARQMSKTVNLQNCISGRGIYIARTVSFDKVSYRNGGNIVEVTFEKG